MALLTGQAKSPTFTTTRCFIIPVKVVPEKQLALCDTGQSRRPEEARHGDSLGSQGGSRRLHKRPCARTARTTPVNRHGCLSTEIAAQIVSVVRQPHDKVRGSTRLSRSLPLL